MKTNFDRSTGVRTAVSPFLHPDFVVHVPHEIETQQITLKKKKVRPEGGLRGQPPRPEPRLRLRPRPKNGSRRQRPARRRRPIRSRGGGASVPRGRGRRGRRPKHDPREAFLRHSERLSGGDRGQRGGGAVLREGGRARRGGEEHADERSAGQGMREAGGARVRDAHGVEVLRVSLGAFVYFCSCCCCFFGAGYWVVIVMHCCYCGVHTVAVVFGTASSLRFLTRNVPGVNPGCEDRAFFLLHVWILLVVVK